MKAPLSQRHLDLLQMIVPHITAVGPDEAEFYTRTENRKKIAEAMKRGFALPSAILSSAAPVPLGGYPIADTDCLVRLEHMEDFARKFLGVSRNFLAPSSPFKLPEFLPWKRVIPVFDPGLSDQEMIERVLKPRINVTMGHLMKYTGSQSLGPRLGFIDHSIRPTEATMGLPPMFMGKWFVGRHTRPMDRRAYVFATAIYHEITGTFLDPETETCTWFPENVWTADRTREVAAANWERSYSRIWFGGGEKSGGSSECGCREIIWTDLKK